MTHLEDEYFEVAMQSAHRLTNGVFELYYGSSRLVFRDMD